MNNAVRRIRLVKEVKMLNRQANDLHGQFVNCMRRTPRCDIRAANIALIMVAAQTLQQCDPKTKLLMQEKFLKTYTKASDAPFTFYKLGH